MTRSFADQSRGTLAAHLRFGLAVVLIALPAVLSTLAYSNPPDPTWIAGLWDLGDFDDAIVLLTDATAVGSLTPGTSFGPDPSTNGLLASSRGSSPSEDSAFPFHLRSPPRN